MPFLTGYNRRKKITIDADTYITSDLSDFPLAVNITSGSDFWTNAPTSGTHVRFTSSDGTTELKFEVESYDTSGNDAWWHVKVPALSSSVDTEIYIYYDADTPSSGEDATNVWDASFGAVYHLTSDENDSTLNANNGTAQNSPARVTGAIDQALDFDGVDDLVDLGSTASYINDTVGTVSFWIKYPTGTNRATACAYGGQDNTPNPGLFRVGTREHAAAGVSPRLDITTRREGFGHDIVGLVGGTQLAPDTWYHGAISQDGTGFKLYINGSEETITPWYGENTGGRWIENINPASPAITMGGGYYNGNLSQHAGTTDELRISSTARSADWIKAEYNSGLGAWVTYGAEESAGGGTDASHSASVQSLTLTQNASSVTAEQSSSYTASLQTLALSQLTSTVTAQQNDSYTAGVQSLTLTPYSASVTTTTGAGVVAGVQSLTLGQPTATVTAEQNITVSAGVQGLSLSQLTASVSTTSGAGAVAGVQSLSLTQPLATVAIVQDATYSASLQTLTVAQPSPSVNIGPVVSVGAQSLTLAQLTPTVSIESGAGATAGVQSLTLAQLSATVGVVQDATATATQQSLSLSIHSPAVSTAAIQGVLSVAYTVQQPGVGFDT